MRIALVADGGAINTNYRAYQPAQALLRRGHELIYNRVGEARYAASRLLRCDAVLIHRYADDDMQAMVKRLRNAGVGVVWDNDDDITAIPRTNPLYRRFGGRHARQVAAQVSAMIELSDIATTPSEVLAASFQRHGGRDVRVLENFLPSEFLRTKPIRHAGTVIVWVAALEHQADYQQLRLRECFEGLLDLHPTLRIVTVGLGLGLRSERYQQIKHVPFLQLGGALAAADIGIAPLAQSPWNEARSNVKLKEYGAARLAWAASPVGPYRALGESEGGCLVAENGWFKTLDALIRDTRRRVRLAKSAHRWARRHGIEQNVTLWERTFEDARSSAIERVRVAGHAN